MSLAAAVNLYGKTPMPVLAWVFLHFGVLRSWGSELFQVRCIQLFGIFGR